MELVPISEAESSHKVKDVPGSEHYQHHENSSDDSSWKMESDLESNSSSGSSEAEKPEEPALVEMAIDGHVEETKGGKRGRAEAVGKTYKLRPRNADGNCKTQPQIQSQLAKGNGKATPSRSRKTAAKKKEEPRKFSIALTQEEIVSDIFAMTGKKPSNRPPKRDKKLQQILDHLSPGFWLHTITPKSYNRRG